MLKQLLHSSAGRLALALLAGGLGAVTLSQASLMRVESNLTELHEFHSPALSHIEDIRAGTGEAIQEGFAYVISGQPEEKEEFLAWAWDFAAVARKFEDVARLHHEEEAEERALFAEIVRLQADLVVEATAMFEEYENSGAVSGETFERYEAVIDQTLTALDEFVEVERSEVAMLYTDSLNSSID